MVVADRGDGQPLRDGNRDGLLELGSERGRPPQSAAAADSSSQVGKRHGRQSHVGRRHLRFENLHHEPG